MSTERFVLYFNNWSKELEIRSEGALGPERAIAAGTIGACVAAKRLFELPEQGTTSAEPYTADHVR